MIRFFILIVLVILPSCVTIEYGSFRYSRFWEDQTVSGLTIKTPDGTEVVLDSADSKTKAAEALKVVNEVLSVLAK